MRFNLEEDHLKYIRVKEHNSDPKPFMFTTLFVKNNQAMTRFDFKESHDSICRYLDEMSVNYGILMFTDGFVVFSEDRVKPSDKLMFKLSTGLNYQESGSFDMNRWFSSRPTFAERYPNLLRDKNDKNS